ncbi:hypothetical protein AUC70_11730 [Methyloceanibacter stevinii]|uniref:Mu-like prophage protein gp36 n=1 Tax=Methyloceanibacter stevinii TaxID=1774970 RepID=A0A1E3VJ34_9HYPH|nr:DUF1320 domain-containing protein [Methyloceanibacter stevinii]ODR93528.1 hypothetical protein AUC70_11730 [Methyloceanibacter stevinii]
MTYTTQAILAERFGERSLVDLTDRAVPATGVVDADVIDRALADADAVIDGYLKGRYSLPLSETPPLLVDIASAIAFYKLHVRSPDEKVKDDYNDALAKLKDISRGVIRLPVEGIEPAASGDAGVRTTDRERPLTPENLKGFI